MRQIGTFAKKRYHQIITEQLKICSCSWTMLSCKFSICDCLPVLIFNVNMLYFQGLVGSSNYDNKLLAGLRCFIAQQLLAKPSFPVCGRNPMAPLYLGGVQGPVLCQHVSHFHPYSGSHLWSVAHMPPISPLSWGDANRGSASAVSQLLDGFLREHPVHGACGFQRHP